MILSIKSLEFSIEGTDPAEFTAYLDIFASSEETPSSWPFFPLRSASV